MVGKVDQLMNWTKYIFLMEFDFYDTLYWSFDVLFIK
jgi:hypothetical protein